ncbi:MAG: radical SAM family heme chaperone HemW [Chloroflexota bacterium]|nr:radical SAM family heme chaperone HemW [Chloroflexota bacterium]
MQYPLLYGKRVVLGGINSLMMYSAYVHIPFCRHRCHYCDFNTLAGMEHLIPDYVSALIQEIRIVSNVHLKKPIQTIYFGGGTPSLIPANLYENMLTAFRRRFKLQEDCEITIEANPGTLTEEYLKNLRKLGVNRISIGVQSTDTFDLTRLDRIHDINDILNSIRFARIAGFENINLDMIFGLPWQDLLGWQHSLSRAISLKPDHFSLYSLVIESGTLLYHWHQQGLISLQDQDLEGDMYQCAMDMLADAGYEQYEISNWAKSDPQRSYQSRHNKQYWYNLPYFGFGAGAHGYIDGTRTVNVTTIPEYIQRINQRENSQLSHQASPAVNSTTQVDHLTQMRDFMMLGLRLVQEGVSIERFQERYGRSLINVFEDEIQSLIDRGIIEWTGEEKSRLRLSKRGVMIANQAFMEFV